MKSFNYTRFELVFTLICLHVVLLASIDFSFTFLTAIIKKGTTGIEPVTTGTAVLCSTTELSALYILQCKYN